MRNCSYKGQSPSRNVLFGIVDCETFSSKTVAVSFWYLFPKFCDFSPTGTFCANNGLLHSYASWSSVPSDGSERLRVPSEKINSYTLLLDRECDRKFCSAPSFCDDVVSDRTSNEDFCRATLWKIDHPSLYANRCTIKTSALTGRSPGLNMTCIIFLKLLSHAALHAVISP